MRKKRKKKKKKTNYCVNCGKNLFFSLDSGFMLSALSSVQDVLCQVSTTVSLLR